MVEPLAVGLHAVEKAQLEPGARVLVIGGGPIGLTVSLWSRFFGARAVVMSEKAAGRRELAARFGATDALDPAQEEVGPAFARLAGGPPDVIFECVGVKGLLQQCIQLAPDRGRVLLNGEEITSLPMSQRARRGIGYLPQEPSVFRKMSVEDNLLAILETLGLRAEESHERAAALPPTASWQARCLCRRSCTAPNS